MISGCVEETSYIRYLNMTGATQQQFMEDRYACYQETQQRTSSAYVDQYGATASSKVLPSCGGWNACLAARGYYRSDTNDPAELHAPGSLSVPENAVLHCMPP